MIIINNRGFFFTVTGLLVAASLISLIFFGLKFSIDFTGGTLVQVTYEAGRPAAEELQKTLSEAGIREYSLRSAGEKDYILRAPPLTELQRQNIPQLVSIHGKFKASISQQSEIGPTVGAELRSKAVLSILVVMLGIILFVAFAFRKVSKPISSWIYGAVALVTLAHDVIIPAGFFAILGHYTDASVDTLFVTALLTVLGFSVHDTIVVFDRVRENLRVNHEKGRKEAFAETAGRALSQTFTRSVNTSLTVVLTLLVLFLVGPASTEYFALTLLVGIVAGTYSSIFLATPLLVTIEKHRSSKK